MSYRATHCRSRIVALSRLAIKISREGLLGEPAGFTSTEHSRYLAPMCVLALEGDRGALATVIEALMQMAETSHAVNEPSFNTRLNDSFNLRSIVEAYHGLIDAGLIGADVQSKVAAWLYDFALAVPDGRVESHPQFEQWHLRNQNVPTTCLYNIAHLLDETQPGLFDTAPLWQWADAQIVGWDLTWRGPDDSSLYQFIWTWSAYLHARYRRPDLLTSENARKSCAIYTTMQPPGCGLDVIFGDAKPGGVIGPIVSALLGARLFADGAMLTAAMAMLDEIESRGINIEVVDRGPEMYRLYTLCPDDVTPAPPPPRVPELITSPLPGRGWSFDHDIYGVDIKRTDKRFPFFGQNTCCWDAMYQVQDPQAYVQEKPDKIVFAAGNDTDNAFALVDLRSHGLHDHADALGVITLIDRGVPWLIESTYMPREIMRLRWYHNVPLFRPGVVAIDELKHWRSDTWREVESGDVWLRNQGDVTIAAALQRGDGYDFVPFTENLFNVQRTWVYDPGGRLIVLDQLTATRDAQATVGQIWHTTADASREGSAIHLARDGQTYEASFAQSLPMEWCIDTHPQQQHDPFYFPPDRAVTDLLRGTTVNVRSGEVIAMAACFARTSEPLKLTQIGDKTEVASVDWVLRSCSMGNVTFDMK